MAELAELGVMGLAVMGANLARNAAAQGLRGRRSTTATTSAPTSDGRARQGRPLLCQSRRARVRRRAGEAARHAHHGQGRQAGRRRDRRARCRISTKATSSSTAATRCSPTPRGATRPARDKGIRFVGMGVSGGEEGALERPEHDARRRARSLGPHRADADQDGGPGRWHALLHLYRPGRRRPLRQDGAQRHRIRRHAAHRRSLRPAARASTASTRRRWPTSSRPGKRATSTAI